MGKVVPEIGLDLALALLHVQVVRAGWKWRSSISVVLKLSSNLADGTEPTAPSKGIGCQVTRVMWLQTQPARIVKGTRVQRNLYFERFFQGLVAKPERSSQAMSAVPVFVYFSGDHSLNIANWFYINNPTEPRVFPITFHGLVLLFHKAKHTWPLLVIRPCKHSHFAFILAVKTP